MIQRPFHIWQYAVSDKKYWFSLGSLAVRENVDDILLESDIMQKVLVSNI